MGESQSKSGDQQFVQSFKQNYSVMQAGFDDPRFGRIDVYKTQEDSLAAVKKSYSQNREELENFVATSLQPLINQISSPYLLRVYGFELKEEQAMCGSSSEMETFHEYYLNNLDAEVSQRNKSMIQYTEAEMWVILYSIITAMTFLEKYQRTINDVRPENIYLTQQGQIKLVPFKTFPEDVPAFQKVLNFQQPCLLAPELMEDLRRKSIKQSSQVNQYKGDVFAAGMTILQCATLSNAFMCYNFESYQIDFNKMNELLQNARLKYSKFFCNMVKALLEIDPEVRPLPSAVQSVLSPYENQILNLQPFNPNYDVIRQSLSTSTMLGQVQIAQQQQPPVQQQQPQQPQVQPQPQFGTQTSQQIQQKNHFFVQSQQSVLPSQQPYVKTSTLPQTTLPPQTSVPSPLQQSHQPMMMYSSYDAKQPPFNTSIPPQQSPLTVDNQNSYNSGATQPIAQNLIGQPVSPQPITQQIIPQVKSYPYYLQSPEKVYTSQQPILNASQMSPLQQQQGTVYPPTMVQQQPPQIQQQSSPIRLMDQNPPQIINNQYLPTTYSLQQAPNQPPVTSYSPIAHTVTYLPPRGPPTQPARFQSSGPQYQSQQSNLQELSEIDRRINEVLQRTRDTLDKVEQTENQNL